MDSRTFREGEAVIFTFLSFLTLLLSIVINAVYTVISLAQNIIFSPLGWFLIGAAVLGSAGTVMTEFGPQLMTVIDWAEAHLAPWADLIHRIGSELAPTVRMIICLFDLWNGALQILIGNAISIAYNCFDSTSWLNLLSTGRDLVLSIVKAFFDWLVTDPLNTTITIISNDSTDTTPWLLWTRLMNFVIAQGDCQCAGFHSYTVFLVSLVQSSKLGFAVHHTVNIFVVLFQTVFTVLLRGNNFTIDNLIIRVQLAVNFTGDWLDEVILLFIKIFKTSAAPNLALGCVASRLGSVIVEVAGLIINSALLGVTQAINTGKIDFFTIIQSANIPNLVGRTHDVSICVGLSVSNLDSCLGQSAAALVDLVSIGIEFLGRFFQQGQINLPLITNGLWAVFGDLTYDLAGGSTHVISCEAPPCKHVRPCVIPGTCGLPINVGSFPGTTNTTLLKGAQSGLICFLSHLFTDTKTARAGADFIGSLFQTVFIPELIADELVTIDYTALFSGDGSPLDNAHLSNTVDILYTITSVFWNRFTNILDYFGHFLDSIPGLSSLGKAVITLAAIFKQETDSLQTLVIYIFLTIIQFFIWLFSLIGASPFADRTAGQETSTFFVVLFKAFVEMGTLVWEFVKGIINNLIFPKFPELFGQNSLLADTNPGTITLTGCFEDLKDCLCGLAKKQIGARICLGSLGCLSRWWPDCGSFNPVSTNRRRRSVFNNKDNYTDYDIDSSVQELDADGHFIYPGNVYDFYAEHYGDNSMCGELFRHWAVLQPESTEHVSEMEASSYLRCVIMIGSSSQAVSSYIDNPNNTVVESDYLMNDHSVNTTMVQLKDGSVVALEVGINNILLGLSDPAVVTGYPELNIPYYSLSDELEKHGVSDVMARSTIQKVYNTTTNLFTSAKQSVYSTIDSGAKSTTFLRSTAGLALTSAHAITYGLSAAASLISTSRQHGLVSQAISGVSSSVSYYWYEYVPKGIALENQHYFRKMMVETPKKTESVTKQDSVYEREDAYSTVRRKRSVSAHQISLDAYEKAAQMAQANNAMAAQSLSSDPLDNPEYRITHFMLPRNITSWDIVGYRASILTDATNEYFIHLSGNGQPIKPLKGEFGDPIITETTIPDSCITVRTQCNVDYNNCLNTNGRGCFQNSSVVCTGELLYIPPFRECNNFFGMAIVAGFCSKTTGQTLDFYYSVQQCKDIAAGFPLSPPFFYNDTLITYPVQIVVAGDIMNTCLDTLHPDLGSICLTTNGCAMCPTETLFPNFPCAVLDRTVSDVEYNARLCINDAGFGPKLPELPTNITEWEYNALEPHIVDVLTFRLCGNGRVEDNYTVIYRNAQTNLLFNFSGEECDPPGSTGYALVNSVNVSYRCGPACQFALCGNGVIDPGEECDVGPNNNGLVCSGKCKLNHCGNGRIEPPEVCDDGNTVDYDGCSAHCQVEICPQYMYQSSISQASVPTNGIYNLCPPTSGAIRSSFPGTCHNFPSGDVSMTIACTPLIPVVELYVGPDCYRIPSVVQILAPCNETAANCLLNNVFPDPLNCNEAVQVGLDFTCTKNCAFCGDNITNNNEQCDDGSVFFTGDPVEDECVFCHRTCTCHPDPKVPCNGFCASASLSDQECDPRSTGVQCGGAPCLAFSCCGDGILQGDEQCDNNPDPLTPNATANCLACTVPVCACQPGKPCLGVCHLNSVEVTLGPTGNTVPLYCDMLQEPFACNSFGKYIPNDDARMNCIPAACCGDHITQPIETEMGFTSSGNCSYIDPTTGLQQHPQNSRFDLYGRRDVCGHLPFGLSQGVCYQAPFQLSDTCSAGPNLVLPLTNCGVLGHFTTVNIDGVNEGCCCGAPPPLNISARIGICYNPNGFVANPRLLCNRDEDNSCVDMNITGGICGAIACCGDFDYYPRTAEIASDAILENTIYGCEPDLDFCFGTPGKCSYGDFMPSFDRCECQPDSACLGRCTYASVTTEILCDPVNALNSPWCPTIAAGGTDPLYSCVPVACCNDGIKMESQGSDIASISISTFPFYNGQIDTRLLLETCDPAIASNPDCNTAYTQNNSLNYPTSQTFVRPWSDCDLGIHTYPRLFTKSPHRPGYLCLGNCVNLTTGISTGQLCGNWGTSLPNCPVSLACWDVACCGNGLLESPEIEECSNDTATDCNFNSQQCGLLDLLFPAKRKRQYDLVQLEDTSFLSWINVWSSSSSEQAIELENITTIITNIEQFNFTDALGTDPLNNFTLQWLETFLQFAGLGSINSTTSTVNNIIDWFSRTGTGQGTPPDQQGLLYWLDLNRACRQPWNIDCRTGVGFRRAFHDFFKWTLIVLTITGVAGIWVGNMPLLTVISIEGALGGIAFANYAWNSSARCLISGIIPKCVLDEALTVVDIFRSPCAHFLDDFLLNPMFNNSCDGALNGTRQFVQCKTYFPNGWTNLRYILDHGIGSSASSFILNSPLNLIFKILPGYNTGFNYVIPDPPLFSPDQDVKCFRWTFLSLFNTLFLVVGFNTLILFPIILLLQILNSFLGFRRDLVRAIDVFSEEERKSKKSVLSYTGHEPKFTLTKV